MAQSVNSSCIFCPAQVSLDLIGGSVTHRCCCCCGFAAAVIQLDSACIASNVVAAATAVTELDLVVWCMVDLRHIDGDKFIW